MTSQTWQSGHRPVNVDGNVTTTAATSLRTTGPDHTLSGAWINLIIDFVESDPGNCCKSDDIGIGAALSEAASYRGLGPQTDISRRCAAPSSRRD
ncbi:MAG: hypothetical protein ACJ72W_11870 [Actinoallomurus sp.]